MKVYEAYTHYSDKFLMYSLLLFYYLSNRTRKKMKTVCLTEIKFFFDFKDFLPNFLYRCQFTSKPKQNENNASWKTSKNIYSTYKYFQFSLLLKQTTKILYSTAK